MIPARSAIRPSDVAAYPRSATSSVVTSISCARRASSVKVRFRWFVT
ncbi:hypothetical protein [Kribbella sp. NPDC000426]